MTTLSYSFLNGWNSSVVHGKHFNLNTASCLYSPEQTQQL